MREPHPADSGAAGGHSVEEIALLRAEMQEEAAESWAAPAFFIPEPQAEGAFWGMARLTAAFLLVGVIVGVIWAVAFDSPLRPAVRVVVAMLISGLAGGTIGFIAGGGIEPRIKATGDPNSPIDDPPPAAERDFILAVRGWQREAAEETAMLLRTLGSERVYLVDAAATLLPPSMQDPLPVPRPRRRRRASQRVAGPHQQQSGDDEGQRHPGAVTEHQEDAEPGTAERDGAEEDHEGGRARDHAAGCAEGEDRGTA